MQRMNGERERRVLPRVAVGVCAFALSALASPAARATPQITSGLTTGVALTDLRADAGPRVAYHLGGRLDVLFLRDKPTDMAIGPYVDLGTYAFDTFETGGGLAWLIPLDATAFVLSAGPFARTSRFGWEPGASATLFWGSRGYNYHSAYAIGLGLYAQGRYGFASASNTLSPQADAVLGVQIDLEYFALPFIFAYNAFR